MISPSRALGLAAAAFIVPALAQTSTTCDPLNSTGCPPNVGLASYTYSADFTTSSAAALMSSGWTTISGSPVTTSSQGLVFNISSAGQAPTIQSNFHILFGRVDVRMRAAPGTGIVSSIVFESSDLDEIDWECLGGNGTTIETNYFGKGVTAGYDRATYVPVSSPQTTTHTYSVEWTANSVTWSIDGRSVRTLSYAQANAGQWFPQTPVAIKLGSWDAGGSDAPQGQAAWAGGYTDFTKAPFVMYVESIQVVNYTPADYYTYSDTSGAWTSIKASNTSSASPSSTPLSGAVSGSSSSSSGGSGGKTTQNAASSAGSLGTGAAMSSWTIGLVGAVLTWCLTA